MDINNLIDKAKDLTGNLPEDIQEKATGLVEEGGQQIPDEVKEKATGLFENLKDKLGL
ncbi:MAG: hypothetical protein ACLSXK_05510 [Lactococcus petauri]|uniref:hypothetical protein n=1 Tax=Lactococcus garvieae TaxID=1363 RepID=UPI00254F5C88|nr:hypothetical protein [Lactococcus garvieae]